MPFYRVSLKSLRRLVQAVADANPSISPELNRVSGDAQIASNEVSSNPSHTMMALSPLGLIDRTEAGHNLSV
jgi:hypothetical protein